MPTINSLVRAWRQKRGFTQKQLASAVGITREGLSLIESGKTACPRQSTITALSRALDTEDLLAFYASSQSPSRYSFRRRPVIRLSSDDAREAVRLRQQSASRWTWTRLAERYGVDAYSVKISVIEGGKTS